jgi:hypothetical protein
MAGSILIGAIAGASVSMLSFWLARGWLERRFRNGPFNRRWEVAVVTKKSQGNSGQEIAG